MDANEEQNAGPGVGAGADGARCTTVFSPAKINLLLAITGRRTDGFHDLVSVVAQLDWGDELMVETRGRVERENRAVGADSADPAKDVLVDVLVCDDPAVPRDGTNLVAKAAAAFRAATGWREPVKFALKKRIPIGAGLGGGSSNAAAALRALNALSGGNLTAAGLARVAADVGSDCALFLHDGPVVMRGRGERVEPLAPEIAAKLRGRRVLVFKPAFGISTAWAYGKVAAGAPLSYLNAVEAEQRLTKFTEAVANGEGWERNLFNNMEATAFAKFPALPVLLEKLETRFRLAPRMSGSGSACFAMLGENFQAAPVVAAIREAWGDSAVVVEARLR